MFDPVVERIYYKPIVCLNDEPKFDPGTDGNTWQEIKIKENGKKLLEEVNEQYGN